MKMIFAAAVLLLWLPCMSEASAIDVSTTTCGRYESEVLGTDQAHGGFDPIDTVMWLFGFSVARAGNHVMYGGALSSFGFALDAVCKNNPAMRLGEALQTVMPKRDNPMDLTTLSCTDFEKRHVELSRTDHESANTVLMWLFGFSIGRGSGHVFEPTALPSFAALLTEHCAQVPMSSIYDALGKLKT